MLLRKSSTCPTSHPQSLQYPVPRISNWHLYHILNAPFTNMKVVEPDIGVFGWPVWEIWLRLLLPRYYRVRLRQFQTLDLQTQFLLTLAVSPHNFGFNNSNDGDICGWSRERGFVWWRSCWNCYCCPYYCRGWRWDIFLYSSSPNGLSMTMLDWLIRIIYTHVYKASLLYINIGPKTIRADHK